MPDGGTLTIVAAGREPVGGETTVIALLDGGSEKHPLLDPAASRTLRTEALVGARKAAAILKARAKALRPALRRVGRAAQAAERGMYATRPHEGSGASSTGSSPRSGWT